MDIILERIASWAPRRPIYNLFNVVDDRDLHIGTFSSLDSAVDCARDLNFDEMYVTEAYMDEMMTQDRVWHVTT